MERKAFHPWNLDKLFFLRFSIEPTPSSHHQHVQRSAACRCTLDAEFTHTLSGHWTVASCLPLQATRYPRDRYPKNMLRWLGVSGCGALGSLRLAPHTQQLLSKKNKGLHFSSFFLRSSSHIHPHSRAANMFRWWTCKLQCILQVSVSDLPGPPVSASPYPVLTTNYP